MLRATRLARAAATRGAARCRASSTMVSDFASAADLKAKAATSEAGNVLLVEKPMPWKPLALPARGASMAG